MERTRGLLERFEAPMIAQTEVELGLKEVRSWAGAAVVLESSRPPNGPPTRPPAPALYKSHHAADIQISACATGSKASSSGIKWIWR